MFVTSPDWDLLLQQLINQHWRYAVLDVLMPVFSSSIVLWICSVAALASAWPDKRKLLIGLILLGTAVAASDLTCSILKDLSGRVRPLQSIARTWYVDDGNWTQLPTDFTQIKHKGSSFPSAHAANSAAATSVLVFLLRKKSIWIVPLLIGYSRIYLGKHFPLDVVAGWILGLLIGRGVQPLYAWLQKKLPQFDREA